MKRTWIIIDGADVARGFRWYQSLSGQAGTLPAHDVMVSALDWSRAIGRAEAGIPRA